METIFRQWDLKAEDLKSRYLYNTNYVIWDNIGLGEAGQEYSCLTRSCQKYLNVWESIPEHLFNYHQATKKGTKNYLSDLELLQYDILYGKQYVYDGKQPITEGHMKMGVEDVTVDQMLYRISMEVTVCMARTLPNTVRFMSMVKSRRVHFLNNTRIELPDATDLAGW